MNCKLTVPSGQGYPSTGRGWGVSRSQGLRGMAWLLGVSLFVAVAGGTALAQQGQTGSYWQCVAPSTANPQGGYCPTSPMYPLPVSTESQARVPVAGTQVGLVISAATAPTVPAGATTAIIQAQGTNAATGGACLFWRDDGTNPTTSAGQVLVANAAITVSTAVPIKLIAAATATCTATISYYK